VIGQDAKLAEFAGSGDLIDFLFENQPARRYDSQYDLVCHGKYYQGVRRKTQGTSRESDSCLMAHAPCLT